MDYYDESSDESSIPEFFQPDQGGTSALPKRPKLSKSLSGSSEDLLSAGMVAQNKSDDFFFLADDKKKMPLDSLVALTDQMSAKEKNRAHAKNTRIRKKYYIESLKANIQVLIDEKQRNDQERKLKEEVLVEQTNRRKRILNEFFTLRNQSCFEMNIWSAVCEPNIVCVLPVTPYRSFPPIEISQSQRYIRGIQGIIFDTKSLDVLMHSLICPKNNQLIKLEFSHKCLFDDALIVEDCIMTKWETFSINAQMLGFKDEIHILGMLKAVYSPANKIEFIEITFDVMSLMQQLHKKVGRSDYLVIPNTPHFAEEPSSDARVIMEGVYPYRIIYVTDQWTKLFGYTSEESVGNTLKMLEGNLTEQDKVKEMMHYISLYMPHVSIITHVTKLGEVFRNWIKVFPLYTDGVPTHFLAVMEKLEYISDNSYLQLFNSVAGIRSTNSSTKNLPPQTSSSMPPSLQYTSSKTSNSSDSNYSYPTSYQNMRNK